MNRYKSLLCLGLVVLMFAACSREQRGWGGSKNFALFPINAREDVYYGLCEYNREGTINQVILLAENVNNYNRFYSQSKEQRRSPEPFGVYYWNRDMHGFWVDGVYISTEKHPCYLVFFANDIHVAMPIELTDEEVKAFEDYKTSDERLKLPHLVNRLDSVIRDYSPASEALEY